MMILKATSFLEGHKRDMSMTFRITWVFGMKTPISLPRSLHFTAKKYGVLLLAYMSTFHWQAKKA
jgi:hypothetical protein